MKLKVCLALLLVSQVAIAAPQKAFHSTPPLTSTTPAAPPVELKNKEAPRPKLIIPSDTKRVIPSGDYFNHPGVVTSKGTQWIGGDNFTNISHSVALQVNIVKPENLEIPFKREDLQSKISEIFSKSGITLTTSATEFEPPLPFFNMMILAYPIIDGMVIAIQGRLFESVEIKRVILEKNTLLQAITWEQTNLVVAPDDEIDKYVKDAVVGIANSFAERVSSTPPPERK